MKVSHMLTTPVFTNIYLCIMAIGYLMGYQSLLWSIACNLAFGSAIPFSLLPLFDPTAYCRQRQKHHLSVCLFYVGHIILHILPCIFIIYHPPRPLYFHISLAQIIKVLWAYCIVGSIYPDTIYVSLEKHVWHKMWVLVVICQHIPLVFFD